MRRHGYRIIVKGLVFLSLLVLAGCVAETRLAPVVNGWQQATVQNNRYRVQRGDTIYSIAWAYGFDYRALAQANHIPPPYTIRVGQVLKLEQVQPVASSIVIARPQPKSTGQTKIRPTQTTARPATRAQPARQVSNQPIHKWLWPANGRVISQFSSRRGGNRGIDISGRYGEPIRASTGGVVVYSGSGLLRLGRLIIIKHNAQYLSAYAHNKVLLVKEGAQVKAGQKIAEMGKMDNGKVCLHFEIRRAGKPVNPMNYLPKR